jgi:hypothetical protein
MELAIHWVEIDTKGSTTSSLRDGMSNQSLSTENATRGTSLFV